MTKPLWLKRTLLATALMNVGGFLIFAPPFPALRALVGLPEAEHALYAWLVALWILFFGGAYARLAFSQTQERLFLQVATAGKASFVAVLIVLTLHGDLPPLVPLAGAADLICAILFGIWLYQTRNAQTEA